MRPHLTQKGRQAYIFGVDAFTQRRISELRDEIAALHLQNFGYAQRAFHMAAERNTRDLRLERLQAIKQELLHFNKPFQRELP